MKPKTVLITGSSRGIGRACAAAFAKRGCSIVLNGCKNKEALMDARREISAYGVHTEAILADAGNYADAEMMIEQIGRTFGDVDILINNAGISYVGLFTDMTPDDWNRILSANLTSVFNCSRLVLPSMISKKEGVILNMSSVWGVCGASCEVCYSATKGGINAMTQALAKELAPSNIRVNAIACGAVDTDMNRCFTEEELAALKDEIPAGRLARPSEIADLAVDLAFGHPYLTGQIIKMDGGWI